MKSLGTGSACKLRGSVGGVVVVIVLVVGVVVEVVVDGPPLVVGGTTAPPEQLATTRATTTSAKARLNMSPLSQRGPEQRSRARAPQASRPPRQKRAVPSLARSGASALPPGWWSQAPASIYEFDPAFSRRCGWQRIYIDRVDEWVSTGRPGLSTG